MVDIVGCGAYAFLFFLEENSFMITYIKGFPKKTKLTYRRIKDDVVERIVRESNISDNKPIYIKKKTNKCVHVFYVIFMYIYIRVLYYTGGL